MSTAVALGDKVRKKEAMETLVEEISRGEDEGLAPSLRSALERGWGFKITDTISEAKERREKEIDKICSRHYSDFLASVKELLAMRGSADMIYKSITDVHEVFEAAYQDLSGVLKTLEMLQTERENSRQALLDIERCRELTGLMVKAKEFIASEDYYRALSTIETLRDELNRVGMRPFASILLTWLASLTDQLLAASKLDLQAWLGEMRDRNSLIGETVLHLSAALFLRETERPGDDLDAFSDPTTMSLEMVHRLSEMYDWDLLDYDSQTNSTVPEDFTAALPAEGRRYFESITESLGPLHKSLHMHTQLGKLPQLQSIYCESRELIIVHNLINNSLEPRIAKHGFSVALADVLRSVVGFFAVESIIRRSVNNAEGGGVFTWNQLKDLWVIACTQVREFCFKHAGAIESAAAMLCVKEQLLLASETLADDAFGLKDGALMEACGVLWDAFLDLQVQSTRDAFTNYVTYQPIHVTSVDMHESRIKPFFIDKAHFSLDDHMGGGGQHRASTHANLDALEEAQMESLRNASSTLDSSDDINGTEDSVIGFIGDHSTFVPHTLPFSETVPSLMRHLTFLVIRFSQFVVHNEGLGERGASVCSTVERAINAIVDMFREELTRDGPETPLSKACQISIDAATLSYCCMEFRSTIANMLVQANWIESIDSHLDEVIVRCKTNLDKLSLQAQDLIFELLNTKVIDLLGDLCFVNWVPSLLPAGPHECIEEIVDYLRVTFMWLTYLPQTVRDAAHFTCCSRINQDILTFLISPKVQHMNMLSIKALQLDFKHLDDFSSSCGVPQLRECFSEGRGLINALLHRDLHRFGENPVIRRANFPVLDPYKLSLLAEKVVPLPPGAQTHSSIPIYDKKTLANISKSLKNAKS
mmetsp:Transcript_23035/g.33715  ORF Transcript_23035/g.33715 Transcript_23035/m.33715 type:complete len:877 (-) Transcript_23035:21-2651(-)